MNLKARPSKPEVRNLKILDILRIYISAAIVGLTSVFRRCNVELKPTSAQCSAWVDPGLIRLWGCVAGSTLDYPWIYPGTTLTNTRLYIDFISTLYRLYVDWDLRMEGWPG